MATLTGRNVYAVDPTDGRTKLWRVTKTIVENQIVKGYNLALIDDFWIQRLCVPHDEITPEHLSGF